MKKYHLLAAHFINDAYYPKNTVIVLPDDFKPTATMELIEPIKPKFEPKVEAKPAPAAKVSPTKPSWRF